MAPPTPRPPWGWTTPVRLWLACFGALGALVMIAAGGLGERAPASPPPAPCLVVDLNSAPPEVLEALPHLGPATVARIVEARRAAPFQSLDDFGRRVRGIGPSTLAALRPFLSVEPADADAEPPRPALAARIP